MKQEGSAPQQFHGKELKTKEENWYLSDISLTAS